MPAAAATPVASGASRCTTGPVRGVPFTAITEDWRLRGRMDIAGRLSDALNKREAIAITDVAWGPPDSTELEPAPGLRSVDPYDLILVTAGEDSLPPLTDTERSALKVHKVAYDVALEVPPFRVVGTGSCTRARSPTGSWTARPRCSCRSRRRWPSSARPRSRTPTSR